MPNRKKPKHSEAIEYKVNNLLRSYGYNPEAGNWNLTIIISAYAALIIVLYFALLYKGNF